MDEKNLKLLEIAGFKQDDLGWWSHPSQPGTLVRGVPNLYDSLDALFKWVVPAFWIVNLTLEEGLFYIWSVGSPEIGDGAVHTGPADENPSHALAEAILKAWDPQG